MLRPPFRATAGHPASDRPPSAIPGQPDPVPVPTAGGLFRVRWDETAKVSALGGFRVLRPISRDDGSFHRLGGGMSYGSGEQSGPRHPRRSGHRAPLDPQRPHAVCPCHRAARRCGQPDVVGDEAGGERRHGAPGSQTHGGRCRTQLATGASGPQHGALLERPWILDVDVTIKPLYGNQEGAKLGYNPGEASSTIPHLPYVPDGVDAAGAGRRGAARGRTHACLDPPRVVAFPGELPRSAWPQLLRGDCSFGSEAMMAWPEMRGLGYLFKLRKSLNVTRLPLRGNSDASQRWVGRCWPRVVWSGIDAAVVGMDSCPTCRHLAPAGVRAAAACVCANHGEIPTSSG